MKQCNFNFIFYFIFYFIILILLRKLFDKATVIKSDLAFGSSTYFIKFLMQSWAQGYNYFDHSLYKHYKFSPM